MVWRGLVDGKAMEVGIGFGDQGLLALTLGALLDSLEMRININRQFVCVLIDSIITIPDNPISPSAHQPISPSAHQPISGVGGLVDACFMRIEMVFTRICALSFLSGLACVGYADDPTPDPDVECWRQYKVEKAECGSTFNDDERDEFNSTAYRACLSGAEENYLVCRNSDLDNSGYGAVWDLFLARLGECVRENQGDSIGMESCIATALAAYQEDINDLLFPDDDACQASFGDIALMNPMYALQSAAAQAGSTNGKYPVRANTSLTFSAGINANPDSYYNVSQVPCIKSAVAIAIYTTKSGAEVVVFDADLDASDGVSFTMHLVGSELVDAKEVRLVSVFYDEHEVPQLGEFGILEIQDSPISGDWNRDEVLNTQDVIDFLDSYGAQTKRADITDDGIVDPADAVEFAEDYTE